MPFFDTHDRSVKFNIDYTNCSPVDVITHCDNNGKLTPLYFRVTNSEGIRESFNVDAIKSTKDSHGYTTFYCVIINHGLKKDIYLRFYHKDHVWVLMS